MHYEYQQLTYLWVCLHFQFLPTFRSLNDIHSKTSFQSDLTYGLIIVLNVPTVKASSSMYVWLLRPFIKFYIFSMLFILWFGKIRNKSFNLSHESYNDLVSCCSKLVISALRSANWVVVKNLYKNLSSSSFHVYLVPFGRKINQFLALPISENSNILSLT